MLKQLNELNIYALRNFAREKGVKSPTSKKRDVLIAEILEIVEGKRAPQMSAKRQGRPPKSSSYFESDYSKSIFGKEDLSCLTFSQKKVEFVEDDMVTVLGYLELVNNGAGLLWVNNNFKVENYFIPTDVLSKHKVKQGDKIVAQASNDLTKKVIKAIFNINDVPINLFDGKRKNFENVEYVVPSVKLKFENIMYESLNVKLGNNCYVYGDNDNDNTNVMIDLLNSVKIDNKIYINISIAEKNKVFVKNLKNCEMFTANILDSVDISKRVIMLAIERAKRIVEQNEDVLIVVDDMQTISALDSQSMNLCKALAGLVIGTKKSGTITMMSVMPNDSLKSIEKLADMRFFVKGDEIKAKN